MAGLYYKDFGRQYVRKAVSANLLRSHDSKTSPSLEFKPRVESFDYYVALWREIQEKIVPFINFDKDFILYLSINR